MIQRSVLRVSVILACCVGTLLVLLRSCQSDTANLLSEKTTRVESRGVAATASNQIATDTGSFTAPATQISSAGSLVGGSNTALPVKRLNWSTGIEDVGAAWMIRQLMLSQNPDDWIKAAALNRLCVGALPAVPSAWSDSSAALRGLHEVVARSCSPSGESVGIWEFAGILPKARAAGALGGLAPALGERALKDGISADEARSLRAVLSQPDLAPAWLLNNSSWLNNSLAQSKLFAGMNSFEREAGLYLTLCEFEGGCKATSLYSFALCTQTFDSMCSTGPLSAAVDAGVGSNRRREIEAAARALYASLLSGDLEAVGLRMR